MLTNYLRRILSFTLAWVMVFSMVPAQAFATETEEEHEHCEVCGQHECICPTAYSEHVCEFVAGEVVSPDCGNAGYTVYTCGCGAVENRDEVPATGEHAYVEAVVGPTQTEQGYTDHTCSVCGDSYQDSFVPALTPPETEAAPTESREPEHEHDFVAGTPVAPTCADAGYTPYVCDCGATENRDQVAALGHSYESVVVEPTAEAQGYTQHTCKVCGDRYEDTYVDFVPQETEPEEFVRQIPEDWTDEMVEVQELIDEYIEYYLGYYGFEMFDETEFAPIIQARIDAEDEEDLQEKLAELPEELIAEWVEICAEIEDIVLNEMDDNERENAHAAVEEVDGLMMYYMEEGLLSEEQAEELLVANPVFLEFADLALEHGADINMLPESGTHTPVEGVTVTVSGATDNSMANGAVTVTAKGSNPNILDWDGTKKTATIKITNSSETNATISFDWTATDVNQLLIDGSTYTGSDGSWSKVINAGEEVTCTITTSNNSMLNKLVMSNFAIVPVAASSVVTFSYDGALGKVTVAGTGVASGGTANISSSGAELVATPNGSTFLGWTDADGKILSTSANYTLVPASDMTVKAIFAGASTAAWFKVDGTHLFNDLNKAAEAGSKIVLAADGILAAGEYTIPSGDTLLIPFDAAGTLYTTEPGKISQNDSVNVVQTVTAYRTLKMASGAKITVNGAMSLSNKIYAAHSPTQGAGSPTGPCSFVTMESGSSITVNSGAKLYAWGFITGSGTVTAKKDSTIYECFQINDWRGGSQTGSMKNRVFPLSQYYVQNIEVPLTLEAGATESAFSAVHANVPLIGGLVQGTTVSFIGSGTDAMFKLNSGSVTKEYDGTKDRLVIEVDGTMTISPMKLNIPGGGSINSADYNLAINSNITVQVNAGSSVSISQDVAMLPGAKIIVDSGAAVQLTDGAKIFIYDADQWGGYVGSGNAKLYPILYAPGKTYTRTASDLVDAEILVNGQVDASEGYVYTTSSGANIRSEGDGKAILGTPGTDTVTHQLVYGGNPEYPEIPVTPAKLKNADGTYTATGKDTDPNGAYYYEDGKWVFRCDTHTLENADATCKTQTCTVCGAVVDGNGKHTPGAAATCTTAQTCTACGTELKPAVNHSNGGNPVDAETPKCYDTEAGHLAYYTCKDCNEPFEDKNCTKPIADLDAWLAKGGAGYVAIPEHTWSPPNKIDATCTADGSITKTCLVSGCDETEVEILEAGHKNVQAFPENSATCTTVGRKAYWYCKDCNTYFSDEDYTAKIDNFAEWAASGGAGYIPALGHQNVTTHDEVPAKCDAFGTRAYYTCGDCGKSYSGKNEDNSLTGEIANLGTWLDSLGGGKIDTLPHTEVTIAEQEATCLAAGTKTGVRCSVCEKNISGFEPIEKLSHSGVLFEGKAATCTQDGHKDYYWCQNGCSTYYSDESCTVTIGDDTALGTWKTGTGKIPALGHTADSEHVTLIWDAETKNCTASAPCINENCNETVTETVGFTTKTVAATCEAAGSVTYTAEFNNTAFGTKEKTEPITQLTHKWGEVEYVWGDNNATCTAIQTCEHKSSDSCVRKETVNSNIKVSEATCETAGFTTYSADFTQGWAVAQTKKVDGDPATGHNWQVVGTARWSLNGAVKSCIIDLECQNNAEHTKQDVEGTVTETGRVAATCDKTGTIYYSADFDELQAPLTKEEPISMLAHNWTVAEPVWTWDDEAGTYECTMTRTCDKHSSGQHEETETVQATVTKNTVTCTAAGEITYKAEFTNTAFGTKNWIEKKDALGHDPVKVEAKASTCELAGIRGNNEYYTCSRCTSVFKDADCTTLTTVIAETLQFVPHSFENYVSLGDRTCVTDGHKTAQCKFNCGTTDTIVDNDNLKTGHRYDEGVIKEGDEPTCVDNGTKTYTCINEWSNGECGHSYTRTVEPLGHELVMINGQEPTCDNAGYSAYYQCAAQQPAARTGGRSYCGNYFANPTDTAADAQYIATVDDTLALTAWQTKSAEDGGGALPQRVCKDEDHDHDCDYTDCNHVIGEHKDDNRDHVCDTYADCAKGTFDTHVENKQDQDHKCDYCGEKMGDHVFTNGVCTCGYVQDLKVTISIVADGSSVQIPADSIKYGHNGEDFTKTVDLSDYGECYIITDVSAKVNGVEVESDKTDNTLTIANELLIGDIEIVVNAQQTHVFERSESERTEATCTAPGKEVIKLFCSKCKQIYATQENELPAKNHAWVETYVEPTLYADGYTKYHCNNDSSHDYEVTHEGTMLKAVAIIGSTKFATLEEAIKTADGRGAIILLDKVVVQGTQVWDLNKAQLYIADVQDDYGIVVEGDLTIKSGTYVAEGLYGIGVKSTGKLTIEDGTFEVWSSNDYLIGSWGTTVIDDGEFEGQYNCVNGFAGSLTIKGGTFATEETDHTGEYDSADVFAAEGVAQIMGGTFSKSVEEYVAEGYCQAEEKSSFNVAVHEPGEAQKEIIKEADCVNPGSYQLVTTCTRCDEVIGREDHEIPANRHTVEVETGKAATCTSAGYKEAYHCSVCDKYFATRSTDDDRVLSDEITVGLDVWQKNAGRIEPEAHTPYVITATPVTCESNGNNQYYKCSKCYTAFVDETCQTATTDAEQVLLAPGHKYVGEQTKDPTCTENGVMTYTCSNDSNHVYTETIEKLNHDYDWDGGMVETERTCTEDGYTTYTCSRCKEWYTGDKVEATGHSYKSMGSKAATCTEAGWKIYYQCQNSCGLYYEWVQDQQAYSLIGDAEALDQWQKEGNGLISAKGHNYSAVAGKTPDCDDAGFAASFKCSVCGLYFSAQENEAQIGDEAAYELWIAEGGDGYHKPNGHTQGEVKTEKVVAPTCEEDGSHDEVIYCTVCTTEISRITVVDPTKGHTVVIDQAVAPTCIADGKTEGKHCAVCTTVLVPQETIDATGHKNVTTVKEAAPTCTEDGVKEHYYCNDCKVYYATKVSDREYADPITNLNYWKANGGKLSKLNHPTTDVIPAIAPTCTEDGLKSGIRCSVCQKILLEQAVDPAKGHTEVTDKAVAATCTTDGKTEGKHCAVCTTVLVPQETIDATGHQNVTTFEKAEPTCTEDGVKEHYFCEDCGKYYATKISDSELSGEFDNLIIWKSSDGKINKLGHQEVSLPAVAPTCTETGLTEGKMCTVCENTTVPQNTVPANGHKEVIDGKVDPTCTETGLTEGKHCSTCQEVLVKQEEVEAKGHAGFLIVGQAAKCELDGWIDHYQCKNCKLFYEDLECTKPIEDLEAWKTDAGKVPMLEHVWNDGIVTTQPTCTEDGVKTFTCGLCKGTRTEAEPMLGHELESHEAQHPTYYSAGWEAYETCKRCEYSTYTSIEPLGEPSVNTYEEFMISLKLLEDYANAYVKANPGKDPMLLLIKYVRTGVDRYNSGSWQIMAGYEDEGFAAFVKDQEEAYNKAAPTIEDMINVTGIKNIGEFDLPNGDNVDFGHMFGTMDITYHNKTSINHADVAGWAGDLVDLLSTADRHNVTGTVEEMVKEIGENYLNYAIPDESDQFSRTDMYGDLDGYYLMNELIGEDYENGMLFNMMRDYFVPSLTTEQRAEYFLENRLGGVTSRGDIRDAVFSEYTGNSVIATLEGTRDFQQADVSDMRKACCYAFADYLCKLAGDYVELEENVYFSVFSSETSTLAPGITQQINKATTADGKQIVYYTATGDVNSPYVQVYANYKDNDPGAGWGMQRVSDQAKAAQAKHSDPASPDYIPNYNVIAAINGSGFNMSNGEPSGVLMMGGVEYHKPNGNGFVGILKDGSATIGTTARYNELKEQGLLSEAIAIFGTTLINDGKISISANSSYYTDRASRTAFGITRTGKVVFMVVDGRQEPVSCGASMREIAQIMLEAGCVYAANLDGGGSTAYIARQEGEAELSVVSSPSDGFERSVSDSWIMVSTAPSSTAFDHAVLDSEVRHLTIGATVQVTAAGVSATGNPVALPEGAAWAVSDGNVASISADGVVTALANGKVDVNLMLGDRIIGSRTLNVVVPDTVYFTKENMNAVCGEPATLPVAALFERKPVAITESDVTFSLSNETAGTTEGYTFIGNEASNIKTVKINAHAVFNPDATSGSININLFKPGEASFDFENADGGDRLLAWKRVVSNSTTVDSVTYTSVDKDQPMVTEYSFGMDMTQIPIPEELSDLVYMLPGADVEGNNSAWSFLLQLAERVSVLTEVKAVLKLDPNFDVDYTNLSVNCEYFTLENTSFDPLTNELVLSLRWKDQTKAIDPDTASPIVILAGIKLTPKDDAAWDAKDRLAVMNAGNISYDIYLRANALYSFALKPENQEAYGLYPFVNNDVIISGAAESGGHFMDTYKEFEDEYTLNNGQKNGWVYEENGYAYYENGDKYLGVQKIGQFYYDFGTNGINKGQQKYTGLFTTEDGKCHYAQEGVLATGWIKLKEESYLFDENGDGYHGSAIVDEVQMEFDNGKLTGGYTGFIEKSDGKTYHYENGQKTYGWLHVGEELYHFNPTTGAATTGKKVVPDEDAKSKGASYDFAEDGRVLCGYFNQHGQYYWGTFMKADAWVKSGADKDPDAWYRTLHNGHFITDLTSNPTIGVHIDGVLYIFDNTNGKLLKGGIVENNGYLYYYWAGTPKTNGWFQIDGDTYYAYPDGHLATGTCYIGGKAHTFSSSGVLLSEGNMMNVVFNSDESIMNITTMNIQNAQKVRFAVWSQDLGEGSRQWYNAEKNGNGVWTAQVPMCVFGRTGVYYVQAYATVNGSEVYEVGANAIVTRVTDHRYTNTSDALCDLCNQKTRDPNAKITPQYRMYNPNSGEHLWTSNRVERDYLINVGWNYEGIGFYTPAEGDPIYRLYHPSSGEHLYTKDKHEYKVLKSGEWNDEGIAFYSSTESKEVPLYRLFNPNARAFAHFYTKNKIEKEYLVNLGWLDEGIGWYASEY